MPSKSIVSSSNTSFRKRNVVFVSSFLVSPYVPLWKLTFPTFTSSFNFKMNLWFSSAWKLANYKWNEFPYIYRVPCKYCANVSSTLSIIHIHHFETLIQQQIIINLFESKAQVLKVLKINIYRPIEFTLIVNIFQRI